MGGADRSQESESEHVESEEVSPTDHHPHHVTQLPGTGVRVHLHQTRLEQVLVEMEERESKIRRIKIFALGPVV